MASLIDLKEEDFINLDVIFNKLTLLTWDLWNKGLSNSAISKKLKISKNAVTRYLKTGNALGKCVYDVSMQYEKMKRPILKLTLDGEIIKEYESLIEAKNMNPRKSLRAMSYPYNFTRKVNNYIWVYKDEYDQYKFDFEKELTKFLLKTKICQIDSNLNLIGIYNNINDASKKTNLDYSNIYATCKGKRKTAYGFRWMYLEQYEKQYGKIE